MLSTHSVDVLSVSPHSVDVIPISPHSVDVIPISPHSVDVIPVSPHKVDVIPIRPYSVDSIPISPHSVYVIPVSPCNVLCRIERWIWIRQLSKQDRSFNPTWLIQVVQCARLHSYTIPLTITVPIVLMQYLLVPTVFM